MQDKAKELFVENDYLTLNIIGNYNYVMGEVDVAD